MRRVFLLLVMVAVSVDLCAGEPVEVPKPLLAIPRAETPPVIDGRITDAEWQGAAVISFATALGTWKEPTRPTKIYASYTDSALYFAFDCAQQKIPTTSLIGEKHDGDVFHEDCVEMFLQINENFYYQFAVGIDGSTYDAMLETPAHPTVSWNPNWKSGVRKRISGWDAEIEIPFDSLGIMIPRPETQWRANFCRENRSDGEFTSWSPVKNTFHEPENFGVITFASEIPQVRLQRFIASPNGVIQTVGEIVNRSPKVVSVRIETYVPLGTRKRVFSLPLTIEPRDTQKFQLVDEIQDEGRLHAVFEVSLGKTYLYRIVRPFEVPPIRSRLRVLSERLKTLNNLAAHLPKEVSARILSNLEALKIRRDAISKGAQFILESTPGQLQGLMTSLDLLERGIRINEFLAHFQDLKVSIQPGAEFILWPADPWVQLRPSDLPDQIPHDPEINALVYRGETAYMAANITNFSDTNLDLRIVSCRLASEQGVVPADRIELRSVAFVKEDADTQTLVGDALPLLDEAGRIAVQSGQTNQVFIKIHTKGLGPGEYFGELKVSPLTGGVAQTIKLKLTVCPLDLPDTPKPWICTWGDILNISWAKPNPDAYLKDAVDHGVNVFLVSPYLVAPSLGKDGEITKPIDYKRHDRLVNAYSPYGMIAGIYSIGLAYDERAKKAGIEYMSSAYRKGFIGWLRDWINHLKSLGLDYKDFVFEVVDEPASEAKFKTHMDIGRLVREADPRARILVTANTNNLDYLRQLSEVVDIWVPHTSVLEDELCRKFIESTGKETWVYVCSGDSKRLDTIGYYRALGWQSFARQLTGWGYFAHMWWGELPWESSNTTNKRLATYSTVYPGTNGPVPSRRWEAFWKGHEDFRALHLLRKLISDAEVAGKDVSAAYATLMEAEKAWDELKRMGEKRSPTEERSAYVEEIRRRVAVASMKLQ